MFYYAIVTDTSEFYKTGLIKVKVAGMYNGKMTYNLTEKFPDQLLDMPRDFTAKVFSPLGGGRNYGLFFLPQVNEKGIVTQMMGEDSDLIWLGSLFEVKREDANYDPSLRVNIPSDDPTREGADMDGAIGGKPKMEFSPDATDDATKLEEALGKHIVLRTKSTKMRFTRKQDDKKRDTANVSTEKKDVDWEQVHTTNIITIAEDELKIIHFSKEDGWNETTPEKWQEIKIKKDPDNGKKDTISVAVKNIKDDKIALVNITEDEIKVTTDNNADDKHTLLDMKDDLVELTYEEGGKKSSVLLEKELVTISSDKDVKILSSGDITIEATGGNVTLKGDPKLILNADGSSSVRFTELKKVIDELLQHAHIVFGPAGPTGPPVKSAGAPPLSGILSGDISGMESKNVRVE